ACVSPSQEQQCSLAVTSCARWSPRVTSCGAGTGPAAIGAASSGRPVPSSGYQASLGTRKPQGSWLAMQTPLSTRPFSGKAPAIEDGEVTGLLMFSLAH